MEGITISYNHLMNLDRQTPLCTTTKIILCRLLKPHWKKIQLFIKVFLIEKLNFISIMKYKPKEIAFNLGLFKKIESDCDSTQKPSSIILNLKLQMHKNVRPFVRRLFLCYACVHTHNYTLSQTLMIMKTKNFI